MSALHFQQRPRPLFHLSNDLSSDDGHNPSSEQSTTMDDLRRYHALSELLTTELGYLMDLRALVTIYLRQLPTLTSRSSTSRTQSPPPRLNSITHNLPPADGAPQQSAGTSPKYLFSDIEIETMTRNAEEILLLHEHLIQELQSALTPFGFTILFNESKLAGDHHKNAVDAAIGAVATMFATKASRFNSYQSFCAGHLEALDLVRKVRQQYPGEWDAFEHRAAALVADLLELSPGGDTQVLVRLPSFDGVLPHTDRQRTRSISSVEGRRSLRAQLTMTSTVSKTSVHSDAGLKRDKISLRLALMDYMIKPVQRICKYPLLLGQLSTNSHTLAASTHELAELDIIVESALQAMRHVVTSVDEARRRQSIATQSAIIISRISLASTHSHPHPALSPAFLSSVGACLLAGSLDVVHYPATSATVKVKYLGAFLYMGGYFVLVKVCKGKVYEPRHWFSLVGFELVDVEEAEAMLPCSFRLSCRGHCFELAAACQREKETWMSSIRESLSLPPTWTNEPVSSLQLDGAGELDGASITSLPTIQSIPELNNTLEETSFAVLDTIPVASTSRRGIVIRTDLPPGPSRRSSSASVKAMFSSDSDTVLIRRSTATTRAQVDNGLQDVISDPCLSARSYASTHEEELFQAPKIIRTGFSRSNSGLSMASAMGVAAKNRLSRHESLRVPRRRSTVEGFGLSGELDAMAVAFAGAAQDPSSRARSLASRRQTRRLSIILGPKSGSRNAKANMHTAPLDTLTDSPTPQSQCSSTTVSTPSSAITSPVQDSLLTCPAGVQQPDLLHVVQPDYRPKRSRSLVDNVKGLFQTSSWYPSENGRGSGDKQKHQSPAAASSGLLKRWVKGPRHRRISSVPDVPKAQLPNSELPEFYLPMDIADGEGKGSLSVQVPIASPEPFESEFEQEFSIKTTEEPQDTLPFPPIRRRSLLSGSDLRNSQSCTGLQRNTSLLQRMKSVDIK